MLHNLLKYIHSVSPSIYFVCVKVYVK